MFERLGLHIRFAVIAATFMLALAGALVMPLENAHAGSLTSASVQKNTVATISAEEKKAYKRAVAACYKYNRRPNPIVVDMSDLNLTRKQAKNVWSMIHANGELFWIDCYGDTFTRKTFTLPCRYGDARIDKMRTQFEREVRKALKRVKPNMDAATKVHMLHDYVLDHVDYKAKRKTAFSGLVQGRADCFGFTLAMDVLLRRAGFAVDVAFNKRLDHSWNLVRVTGKWYHVDATWDNGYCGQNYEGHFNWSKKRCHLYLLQSDKSMNSRTVDPVTGCFIRSHAGWTCHHACKSTKYDFSRDYNKGFYRHCRDYKTRK